MIEPPSHYNCRCVLVPRRTPSKLRVALICAAVSFAIALPWLFFLWAFGLITL